LNGKAGAIIDPAQVCRFTRFLANKSPYPPFATNFPRADRNPCQLEITAGRTKRQEFRWRHQRIYIIVDVVMIGAGPPEAKLVAS
jgi:hypothetical protein